MNELKPVRAETNIKYRIWSVTDGHNFVCSRGRDQDDVLSYVMSQSKWLRGQTVWVLDQNPIFVAESYSQSHPFDWLNQKPRYLMNDEEALSYITGEFEPAPWTERPKIEVTDE